MRKVKERMDDGGSEEETQEGRAKDGKNEEW